MGQFREIKGDLIQLAKQGTFDLIAHGCNCQKMMGAGIALQIKEHFPKAYMADKKDTRASICRLGDMTIAVYQPSNLMTDTDKVVKVLNLYTQFHGGANLDPTALRLVLRKVNHLFEGKSIGLPLIGCGIAGGVWSWVKDVIIRELRDMDVTIVHYSRDMVTELDKGPKRFNHKLQS